LNTIESIHKKIYESTTPEVIAQAPVVCTLLGAYAEACQGFSLICCSNKFVKVAMSKSNDNMVKLFRVQGSEKKHFTLNSLRFRKEDRWANYVKGLISILTNEGYKFSGMNITIQGDIFDLYGSALSGALAIASILALDKLYHLELQIATIMRVVFQSNSVFNDEVCKIAELMAIINGKKDQVMLLDLQHLSYSYVPFHFDGIKSKAKAFIVNSKIAQTAIRTEYNNARKCACSSIDKLWKQYQDISKRDIPEKDITSRVIPLAEDCRQTCVFVLRETKYSVEAAAQLEQSDYVQYGKTMNKLQIGFRDRLEVTCPEVDWLIKRAGEVNGCFGASLIFDGNGGTIMILLDGDQALEEYKQKIEEYGHIFGFSPEVEDFSPQDGAKVLFP